MSESIGIEATLAALSERNAPSCCALDCLSKGFDHCKGKEYDEYPDRETFALPDDMPPICYGNAPQPSDEDEEQGDPEFNRDAWRRPDLT